MSKKTYIAKIEFGFPDGWVNAGTESTVWEDYYVFPYVGKNFNDENRGWMGNGFLCKWPEEYPKFFKLKEEPQSNDSFQWTDDDIKDILFKFCGIEGKEHDDLIRRIKLVKQSHTPKPESYSINDGKLILPKHIAEQLKPQAENTKQKKVAADYLFSTSDGKPIYIDDEYWKVFTDVPRVYNASANGNYPLSYTATTFSTKEAAEAFIQKSKSQPTEQRIEVREFWYECKSSKDGSEYCFEVNTDLIPLEKRPLIKQAIEQVLNDEWDEIYWAQREKMYRELINNDKTYTQQQVHELCNKTWDAAFRYWKWEETGIPRDEVPPNKNKYFQLLNEKLKQ